MKNRTWLPKGLDLIGLFALASAVIALGSALYLAASAHEAQLLLAFKYSLMTAVSAFLVARACEISRLLQRAEPAPVEAVATPDNVETLSGRESLPRAA